MQIRLLYLHSTPLDFLYKILKSMQDSDSKTLSFIEKASLIHGTTYDYSKVEYIGPHDKVCITCRIHGDFWQTPACHIYDKNGCPTCGHNRTAKKKTLSTEKFINKSKEIHGDRYDYSKVNYIKSNIKVCIICPEHGEFWQTPNAHTSRASGCPTCGHNSTVEHKKISREIFISRSIVVHGTKYDYSKVKYTKSNIKVCIICPEHGEFWQTPASHLSGNGCSKCGFMLTANKKRLSTEDFITRANKIHHGKYDYSKVNYINADSKVCIICPEHGEFMQTPSHHIGRGDGCPVCRYHKSAKSKTFTTEKFIHLSKQVHGDKYDYSKSTYVKARKHLIIICPQHGEFIQTATDHMNGQGCPTCGRIRTINARRSTTDIFIEQSQKVHKNKYDYSLTEYLTNRTPVKIICSKHGIFKQTPHEHLSGCGCPKCFDSSLEKELIKLFDELGIKYEYQKKFAWLGRQSLDFYLPDVNIGIECQGLQHYISVDGYMGGEKGLQIRQGLDKRKKRLCNEHNITIIYYDHTKFKTFLGETVIKAPEHLLLYIKELINN